MNKSFRWIGRKLKRDHSVIQREVTNNSGDHTPYRAETAQRIFDQRQKKKNKPKLEKTENYDLRAFVISQLREDWSPEQIAGALKENPFININKTISHESIYQYIYNGEGSTEYLYHHLRTRRPKRINWYKRRTRSKPTIKNRISIHARPDITNELGHLETDSMIFSKQKNILSVQYEKKSMICRIKKLPNKTAEESENAIWNTIETLPNNFCKTITRDNGTENAKHEYTWQQYGVESYFCDGYCPWQKGGVENVNKLIRQYLPRKINLSKITDKDIYTIQEQINNRPRKLLNYLSPNQFLQQQVKSGAIEP